MIALSAACLFIGGVCVGMGLAMKAAHINGALPAFLTGGCIAFMGATNLIAEAYL